MPVGLEKIKVGRREIWVEVAPIARTFSKAAGGKTVATSGGAARGAVSALVQADIADTLTALLAPIHQALGKIGPKEVTVELSLGIKGEVGVFVAKGEGNASLKVSAKWTFDAAPPNP